MIWMNHIAAAYGTALFLDLHNKNSQIRPGDHHARMPSTRPEMREKKPHSHAQTRGLNASFGAQALDLARAALLSGFAFLGGRANRADRLANCDAKPSC